MNNRIIYYYQTFDSLQPILKQNPIAPTHIHLSSFHFGKINNKPYIHLNDNEPTSHVFSTVWSEIKQLYEKNIIIMFMLGGAGGAFTELFSDFETYYGLFKQTIELYPYCHGIDLDVEEEVDINNIIMLIKRIKKDFGDSFKISMAPVSSALEYDQPGMGGFSYKKLISVVGDDIEYFNGQFYGDDIIESYTRVINNGYQPEKIVYGMISSDGPFDKIKQNLQLLKKKYPKIGGVFIWEYFDSPPGNREHPELWSEEMKQILNKSYFDFLQIPKIMNLCNIS